MLRFLFAGEGGGVSGVCVGGVREGRGEGTVDEGLEVGHGFWRGWGRRREGLMGGGGVLGRGAAGGVSWAGACA